MSAVTGSVRVKMDPPPPPPPPPKLVPPEPIKHDRSQLNSIYQAGTTACIRDHYPSLPLDSLVRMCSGALAEYLVLNSGCFLGSNPTIILVHWLKGGAVKE